MAESLKKKVKPPQSELLTAALFGLMALAVVLYVRVRLLGMPFERDEGEYAYSGQLIMQGLSPYLHAYTMKLPGMAYLNAIFLFCLGTSVTAVRLGLLAANILAALLLFAVGRKLLGTTAALLAAALYGLMTLSQHLLGTFAHATHFIVLFVLAAYLCIINEKKPLSQYRYFFAGILFGCAFAVKQHAVFFLIAGALSVLFTVRPARAAAGNIIAMLLGFAAPYGALLLLVLKQGAFSNFWYWTVRYASSYATGLTPLLGWLNLKSQLAEIFAGMLPYWLLALIGLLLLLARRDKAELAFILPLALAAFLAICPGFHFRPHYFILVAPVIALLAGGVVSGRLLPASLKMFVMAAFFAAAAFQFWNEGWFLFAAAPQDYVKKAYQTTKPFVEAKVVADYLAKHTQKGDRIQVLGSEPQIYFYADRLAASGYIYMYPLMEEQPYAGQMQQGMLREMTAGRPAYLVLVDDLSSWLAISAAGETFREKLNEFVMANYELDGVARVSRDSESFYVFGERAGQFVPDTGSRILVYRLKKS